MKNIRPHKGNYIVELNGCHERKIAETFTGYSVGVDVRKMPNGMFLIEDILGSTVYDFNNQYIGRLKDVYKLPASDVYVIQADDKEILLPALKRYIKSIDVSSKKLYLTKDADEVLKGEV